MPAMISIQAPGPDAPTKQELQALDSIWANQEKVVGHRVDFTDKSMRWPQPLPGVALDDVAAMFQQLLGWPAWVRLFARPPHAVLAASQLARQRGLNPGVRWVAPGAGAPFDPPKGPPGVDILRADWASGAAEVQRAAARARSQGLVLVVDESLTGFRLSRRGATEAFGLEPDAVLLALELSGGVGAAILAGIGEPPRKAAAAPDAAVLAQLAGLARWLGEFDLAGRLNDLGRGLEVGLHFFRRKAMLDAELFVERPWALPRLGGKRVWAFMELAREEGLLLDKMVMLDAGLDLEDMQRLVWPRLARAVARLRVLPEGQKAPGGWRDAGPTAKRIGLDELLPVQK